MFGFRRPQRAAIAAITLSLTLAACTSPGSSDTSSGLNAERVRVGFIIVDVGELSDQLGFKVPNYGGVEGQERQIKAFVDTVNANGGAGGRQIEPVIKTYSASNDSPELTESLCNAFAQDENVFAVVLDGAFQNNARGCYSQRGIYMIDQTLMAQDEQALQNFAPYLWSPTWPAYNRFISDLSANLTSPNGPQGAWLSNANKIAFVAVDTDTARRQVNDLGTQMDRQGIKHRSWFIDSSNAGTLGAGASSAWSGILSGQFDRVMIVGGARILPVFLSDAQAETSTAKIAISTYDNPIFLTDNPDTVVTSALDGMQGLSLSDVADVRIGDGDGDQELNPDASPSRQACLDIATEKGVNPEPNRANYKQLLLYCDATLFLDAVLDSVGEGDTVSSDQFAKAVSALNYTSALTGGRFNGEGAAVEAQAVPLVSQSCGQTTCFVRGAPSALAG
jgi:Periplasmic binding protein